MPIGPHRCAGVVVRVCLVLTHCAALPAQSGSYLITTVAGNGGCCVSGDGGQAVNAWLYSPTGVAVDSAGNVFIADNRNYRVRKVSSGIITTVAGNGVNGYNGDNIQATGAQLVFPTGVAVDAAGNLYIVDFCRIRKVSNGVITTVAGNGDQGFSGDNGPATSASLDEPNGVVLDSAGNIYIADTYSNRIRKVSNGIITTVAGGGTAGFSGDNGPATSAALDFPSGVALDSAGDLYIVETGNNRIRMVTPNGVITTVAGSGTAGFSGDNGPATSAELSQPGGVAVDSAGNLYISDSGNNIIRKVSNGTITTVAGGGAAGVSGNGASATLVQILYPLGVAEDASGNVFIAETNANMIRKLVPSSASAAGCVYSIDQSTQSFAATGGVSNVGVLASEAGCPWLALSYANWIAVNPSVTATGTGLVIDTVSPNPDSASRGGTLWIAGQSLTVNQSGVVCSLGVSPRSVFAGASGLTGASFTITSNAPDCGWDASASVPWILVSGGGTGSGTVTFTVGVNTGNGRAGTITAAGQGISVTQDSACDLTGEGISKVANAQLIINEALGLAPAVNDLNYDGVVNVADIQPVIIAALGLGCTG